MSYRQVKKDRVNPSKVNVYRRSEIRTDEPGMPILNTSGPQIFDLNGFIRLEVCSKYSYQIINNHPTSTFTVQVKTGEGQEVRQITLSAGEIKRLNGLPHRQAWLLTTYPKENFEDDQIDLKEQLNLVTDSDLRAQTVTDILDKYFTEKKPQITFVSTFDNGTDEITAYEPKSNQWKNSLDNFLSDQQELNLNRLQQNEIISLTEQLLTARALRSVSKKIEEHPNSEDQQKLIYPIIKKSKNFRRVSPRVSLSYSQSLPFLKEGINTYWHQQKNHQVDLSFRLPLEWQFMKRNSAFFSNLHIRASFESLLLDFNRNFEAFAINPESVFEEPELVEPSEQFALQTTQLSTGLVWKFYFPLPIIELEGGTFIRNKTRLLWGEDQGKFPASVFSPKNEIIADITHLSNFRPYFGARVGIPFYFSGYQYDCDSRLRNIHLFAGFRMFPVDFSKNENYSVFIRDPAGIDFIPIPLEDGNNKYLMHFMIGGAAEF